MKTHNAFAALEGYPFSTPEHCDRAIYVIRDPRDVLFSLAHHLDQPLDAVVGMMTNRGAFSIPFDHGLPEFWSDWGAHVRSWAGFPCGSSIVIRYEDLLADPHAAFGGLTAFLGWPDSDAAIRAAVDAVEFGALRRSEAEEGFVEAPGGGRPFFRRGVAGGWREQADASAVRVIEDAFGDVMARYGYR